MCSTFLHIFINNFYSIELFRSGDVDPNYAELYKRCWNASRIIGRVSDYITAVGILFKLC